MQAFIKSVAAFSPNVLVNIHFTFSITICGIGAQPYKSLLEVRKHTS
ncbi:unnamed protein product [Schistosoma curassoni]|uniref:Uncharacterized protein n=1 Tax=Schistosoma curassoni TaxID=6186 RepID=A0A183JNN6_9TREM|nr:unnamed protein product [Schistosoma curassoni]